MGKLGETADQINCYFKEIDGTSMKHVEKCRLKITKYNQNYVIHGASRTPWTDKILSVIKHALSRALPAQY